MNRIFFILTVFILGIGCNGRYEQGKRIYNAKCASCHMEDGTGLRGVIPPLANSDYLKKSQQELVCQIRLGIKGPIIVNGIEYNQEMKGVDINDVQLTNVINYINTAWGNEIPETTFPKVKEQSNHCPE